MGLSKTIGFYLADETQSKQFTKALTWQGKTMYLEKNPRLTRSDIEYIGLPVASAGTEKTFTLTFTKTGLKRVNKITSKNMNKFLVIAVDGQMAFSAQIKTEIGQEVQITDGTQTDGVSLFSKMCPNPNIF